MQEATNIPYVKQYAIEDGVPVLQNPIENGIYLNDGSNRTNRKVDSKRFMSNKSGISLIAHTGIGKNEKGQPIIIRAKYKKVAQRINRFELVPTKNGHKLKKIPTNRVVYHEVDIS